ncbi:TPA: hypothetical protein ACH3X1_007382 [Trebouxia sp. C0004]
MFEQYISDWLTSYLGHFLDIKRENLRANILSAFSEPAGLTLKNVKLKTEALDFFQLPVAVEKAVVGSLHVRCPWGFRGRNVIELSDVFICVSPRPECDWEEGPAKRRAYATKRAQLSAAEASRQLTGASSGQKSGYGWSFLTWSGSILLNKLQFRMKRTHICFKAAKVLKDISVQQLSLYWQASNPEQPPTMSSMELDSWQHIEHPAGGPTKPMTDNATLQHINAGVSSLSVDTDNLSLVLPPTNCDLRVSMKTDKHTGVTRLGAVALVERVQLHLHKAQISDIARMQDQYAVWNLHNQYAALRPTGWRSDAAAAVTPRRLWQYAIQAVLQDLGQHQPRKLTGATLLEWRDQRQRYVELWTHHLQSGKGSSVEAKQEQEQAQIEALEMQLLVTDILLFRHLASRALKRRPSQQGSHTTLLSESSSAAASKDVSVQVLLEAAKDVGSPKEEGSPKEDSPKEGQCDKADSPTGSSSRQGWWTWGLSGVSSILGYVPSKEHPQAPPLRPSQAEMQELFATLSLDPHNLPDGRDPSRKLEVVGDVKIASGSVSLSGAVKDAQAKQLASIDLEKLNVYVQLSSDATHAKMAVQEITVQDLGTGAADCAGVVLARWQQPGSGSSSESVEHATARSSGSISPSNSFVVVPELMSEPPVLKMQFDHKADASPKLEVWVHALHVTHRPTCWAALSALTAGGPKDTQSSRVAETANLLNDSKAQTLAQAQRAIQAFTLPQVAIQVEDVVVSLSQHGQPASEGCSIVHTGAIQISHQAEAGQPVQQQHLIHQLQQHCIQQKSSKEALQELLTQVQTKVLYQRLCITLDAVQLSTSTRSSSLSSAGTTVLSPCRCIAYLDLHRASGDALLPQLKALVELDRVQVHLTPASMATLQCSLLQSSGPADAEQSHSETEQTGQPLAEVNVTAGTVSMAFDDHQSQDADARNTHLKLRGQKLDLLLEVLQDAIATKATLLQLHASDRSQYTSKNPKIYGIYSVPRLAQVMSIDSLTVRVDHSRADGLLVSGRLMGATAKGWPGESGSMISRLTSKTPAQAEFTVYNTVDHLQTSITLQDGCFGTATLMRIAALFMPPPTPASLNTSEAPAISVAATVAESDRLTFEQHTKSNLTSFGTDGCRAQPGNESAFGLSSVPESCPQGVSQEPEQAELLRNSQTKEVPSSLLPDAPESRTVDLGPKLLDGVQRQSEQELAEPAANGLLADAANAEEDMSNRNSQSPLSESHRSSADHLEAPAPLRHALGRTDLPSPSPPMMPSADPGLLSAIETPLSGASHGTQAEMQAAATAVSAMALEGVTTMNVLPEEEQAEGTPAGIAEGDRSNPVPTDPAEEVVPKSDRKEQFSLEIVRCKIVCPAKVDTNAFSDADPSPLDHTLYMEIPHFILQLPVSQPAQHPRPHPVDMNVRHVLNRQQPAVPAPDAIAPSPFASNDQQGMIFSVTNLTLYVALPEEFDLPESVATSSEAQAQLPPFLIIPTASLIALPPRPPPQHACLRRQLPQQDVPTFELEMKTAEVTAKPKQLQTISASTIRYSTEMDNILGKSPSDPPAPVLAAIADPPLQTNPPAASSNRDHPRDQHPLQKASQAETYPGFAVEASVGLASLQLHSSSPKLPALVLQWQRLSGHYAQAAGQQQATACGLTWHYLALHLTENPAEPCQQLSLEHVGTLRSGSLLLPGRISRVHSEPLDSHGAPSSSRSSHHGGSGRLTRGLSTRHHITAARTISADEELLSHQHSLSKLHVAPLGNGRTGLGGLTGLAEIAADDDGSTPSSPQYIFNNRARLASDSFNEMLEGVLPSLSALSLQKAANQQHDNSDNGSSSVSGSHSHRRHRLDRLKSLGRATSVASSTISVEELQRQVPVIRHRSVFMNPTPPTPYADAPEFSGFTSVASSFDLSSAPSVSSRQALTVYHDAPDRLDSSLPDGDMPTSPGGTPVPEGWSPDMLPAGDRLLLLLGSKECFAASDGIASSSTDASIGCSLLPAANDADIPLQSALEICASDMMLRVYLEGWQLLIYTSYESIEAVMKGQQPHQQASSTHPSQHDPNQLARSRSMDSLAAAAQGLSIQLHATEVVAELVGNIFPGENALSPCISVRTAITIDSHTTAGGQLQHCLAVPRLAVATALMELPPDIRSMVSRFEGGVLMGALNFQATLTLPIVASDGSPPAENRLSLQLEEHTPHPQQQLEAPLLAVDLQLDQLCIYASQRRLCITAALVKAFQEVQEGLLLAARPRTTILPAEVAPTPKAQSMLSFETLLKTRCSLRANKMAVLLSNDKHDDDTPIIEAVASDIMLSLSGQAARQQLSSQCGAKLGLDVYNNGLMGWEPLLEPWTSSLAFSMPLTRQGGREDSQLVAQQLSVTLKTQDTLELTFTQAVVSCYQAAQGVFNDVALVAAEPTTLEDFWSGGPGQSKRTVPFAFEPSDLGEGCLVSPGESNSVIPLDVDNIICKGHHVADPQVFLASASTCNAQAASSSADNAASSFTPEEVRSHRQAGLKVLVRLQGQGASDQPLGPWALDMEQKSMKEVQLCAPTAQSAPQSFKVYCQVARGVRGGAGLTIHSGIRLHNNCGVLLSIGMQQRWPGGVTKEGESARTTKLVAAGDSLWLPALCCKASYLSLQPADDAHHWCPGVPLLQLLHQAEYAFPASHCQNLVCSPVDNRSYSAHFCLGAAAVPHSQGYTLVVKAPIELYNALPMPLTVALSSTDPNRSSLPERMLVQPLQSLLLHHMGAFDHLDKVALEPSGYCLSSAMGLPHGPSPRNGSDYCGLEVMGKASVQVHKHRREDGSASLLMCHCYDLASGAHALRVSCSLWVFNCTGLPIALRQSWLLETLAKQELLHGESQADAVPTAWVPPYRGSSQHPLPVPSITRHKRSSDPYHTPTQSSQSSSMAGRMSSRFNLSGLGEVLTPASVHSQWGAIQQSSIGSNPKGLSDTGQVAVMHQTPTRYASMQGDVEAHRQKVRLQLCATTATSHSGKAFWSDSVQLDALGGAAVVEAPCPMTGGSPSQKEAQAGYRLAVTAVQIPDGDGALALHVMPRYMLHNNLQAGVQYKQQGQSVERDLLAGGARAMHWPDVTKPKLRLCLRLHEAGWLWSGGFALDTPGDLFVKIRHREQEVTRLVRVDVSTSANGVLAVALSEQEKGFAPYRLDNCTGLKLHLRQKGCIEQDDLLRPYSSLDYAWDEPALPHQLLLELPGNRRLGTYDLDRVGSHYIVTLAATAQRAEQRIQVCVRADGPKRVLQLIDLLVHMQPTTAQQELVRSQLGWKPWSGTLHPGAASRAASCGPALAGVSLEVQVQVGGLGVSVVGAGEELLHGRISGIQVRAVTGVARQTLELAIQQVQVDNPLQNAAYPIALTSPNTQSSYGVVATAMAAAATAAIPKPAALCLRWSVWRTRPGHVLCVERLEMQTAPLLLEVEQAHAMQLMQFGQSLLAPFADASHAVRRRTPHEPDLMVLRAGGRQRVGGDKVYIEYLHVNKLQITLSFLPSPGVSRGYQWFISVAGEVEGGYLGLAPLQLHHPLLGRQALVQLVHSHYMRAALPGLINMLGSSNVLGSPLSVIHHLQLGVWSFLASPAQGLKESTQGGGLNLPRLVDGFVEGSRSLASNVVLAVSTATAKTTNAARKGLINLGLDKLEATAVPFRQRLQLAGSSAVASPSGPGFLPAVAEGLTGFVREPVRGVRQYGLAGLPFGVMRGSLGLFGHPLGSLLGTAASLSNSIRNSLLGVAMLPPRLRPPRHVSAREPLSLYNYVNALGRTLLRTIEGGKYFNEGFVACRQLSVSTGFVIITRVHILAVSLPHLATSHWTPALTWAAALGDLEHCSISSTCPQELHFLVMQPELNLLQSQQLLAQKTLGLRLSARLPWQAYTAAFQSARDVAETLRLVQKGRQQVCMYGLLPVHRGGALGGSWWQGTMLHDTSMQQAMHLHAKLRHNTVVQQIHAVTC